MLQWCIVRDKGDKKYSTHNICNSMTRIVRIAAQNIDYIYI